MAQQHESYTQLIWTLAKTDFTLRYHGSVLGYLWALLKPLLIFLILYFVFSSIFNPKNTGQDYYALELIIGIMMFTFFAEGTTNGMNSLLSKAQLVTKIYVPRWTLIVAATVNAAFVYCVNLLIIIGLFVYKGFLPSLGAIALFLFFSVLVYVLILAFSLLTAPLLVKFRDLGLIWEVAVQAIFYATPIIYPLTILPLNVQQILLINPMAFIIHFTKESLINQHFADVWQYASFIAGVLGFLLLGIAAYRRFNINIAEEI